jgi:tellurite resistance protein TehA-like permease
MATGIVSIGAEGLALPLLAEALFAANLVAYAVLAVLTLLRAAVYPQLFFGDLVDHRLGPGFFTAVAGSCLIGAQFLVIAHSKGAAVSFLVIGTALWVLLTYAIFTAFTIKPDKPSLVDGLSGVWLVAVVATQSIAVLATLAARNSPEPIGVGLDCFALSMWLWGVMFYIWLITLTFYRYAFCPLEPADLDSASWIAMGAMAISALAGASLAQNAADVHFLGRLSPFVEGLTLLCWVTGTWWIPLLLALSAWRLTLAKALPHYDPSIWAAVFPLGMYGEATREMAIAFEIRFLHTLSRAAFAVAAIAWTVAFVGLLWNLGAGLARRNGRT